MPSRRYTLLMGRAVRRRRCGVAASASLLLAAFAPACDSGRDTTPTVQPLPRVAWTAGTSTTAPDVDPLLERSNLPGRALQLGDQPLDAWAEAGALVVFTEHGHVQ